MSTDQARIHAYFDDPAVERELVAAVSRLAAIRSVKGRAEPGKPFGPGPAAALEEALALCGELGFRTQNDNGYVGLVDLGEQEADLHILAHLDVVGEGSGWTVTEPYTPKVVDGLLYGRGVADDKGPAVAALFAMKAVRDMGIPLKSGVRLILGTDEESGSKDIAYYYGHAPYARYTFSPDADFPLIHIEKGQYCPEFGASWTQDSALPQVTLTGGVRANVVPPQAEAHLSGLDLSVLEPLCARMERETGTRFSCSPDRDGVQILCEGRAAHASTPQEGSNALTALLALLSELPLGESGAARAIRALHALFPHGDTAGQALGIAQSDELSGELTLNLALMTLTETGFTAKFDARVPLCASADNCKRVAEAAFARYGISVTGTPEMTPGHHVPVGAPLVQTLLHCYSQYSGEPDPKPIAIGGGTYVHNIPGGVAFGPNMPGFDCRMHGPDERIRIKDLLTASKIFTQAILDLCS